jgi:hypothetical protein
MQRKHIPAAMLLACATVALALLGAASAVHATSPDFNQLDTAHLERLFWDCDARATHEALPAGDGALCVSIGDALKQRCFDGDFQRLLDWWRAGKAAEHAARGFAPSIDTDEAALQTP